MLKASRRVTKTRSRITHSSWSALPSSVIASSSSSSSLRSSPFSVAANLDLHHRQIVTRGPFSRAPLHRSTRTTKTNTTTLLSPASILSRNNHSAAAIQEELFGPGEDAMTATKIDGTAIAKSIRERLHKEIEATQKSNPRYNPSLKIIQGMALAN